VALGWPIGTVPEASAEVMSRDTSAFVLDNPSTARSAVPTPAR
jgi:hypothetical protein